MNATVIVSIFGIAGTLAGALLGPFATGRIGARNTEQAKLFDLRIAVLVEALAYAQSAKDHLTSFASPDSAPEHVAFNPNDHTAISARLSLLVSGELLDAWTEFVHANLVILADLQSRELASKPRILDRETIEGYNTVWAELVLKLRQESGVKAM